MKAAISPGSWNDSKGYWVQLGDNRPVFVRTKADAKKVAKSMESNGR